MLKLIHENELCNAKYDPAKKMLRTQYVGIVRVDAITDLLRAAIEFSSKEEINTMIANLTEMKGTFTGALDFFENEFYPTMIKNGMHSYACALSEDAFTRFASAQLKQKVGGKLDWQAFSNIEDAEKWMDSQIELHSTARFNFK